MLARFDHHPMLTTLLALTTAALVVVVITLATLLITAAPPAATPRAKVGPTPALQRSWGEGRCAMLMRPFSFMTLALVALVMLGCSLGGGGTAGSQQKPPVGTFELPNGRSLYMECRGTGSPTIVFEVGLEEPISDVSYVQDTLARQYMTCSYDRANNGKSGKAPTPRTAGDVVNDLHQLLETAEVPGPYVLPGSSYGGFFVQLYGRRYSDEVAGVVAMNPEPPADQVVERIHPLPGFSKEVREQDRGYFREENPEGIDWFASSEELKKAPPPPPIPFEMLLSKKEPGCEGDSLCLKSDDVYVEIEREIAQQWPQSSVRKVYAGHVIFLDKPEVALDAVKRVASK